MQKKRENIYNIPNALSFLRLIITIAIIILIFSGVSLSIIAILFFIGMFTDALDGQIARRFHLKTKFGANFDMFADRFLMLGTALALIIYFFISNQMSNHQIYQLAMMLSREILIAPIFLFVIISKKKFFPKAKLIGKVTTVLQAITLPLILFGFTFSIYFAILTMLSGVFSAIVYIKNI